MIKEIEEILPKSIEVDGDEYYLEIKFDGTYWVVHYVSNRGYEIFRYSRIDLAGALRVTKRQMDLDQTWSVPLDALIEQARPYMEKVKDPEKWLKYIRGYED